MAKRAPVEVLRAGTVHPGKYLVLVGGAVADIEEALEAGREIGGLSVRDAVFLPNIHPEVVDGVRGARHEAGGEALGVIETATAGVSGRLRQAVKDQEFEHAVGRIPLAVNVAWVVARATETDVESLLLRLHERMLEMRTAPPGPQPGSPDIGLGRRIG